jgi:hypothetical protein
MNIHKANFLHKNSIVSEYAEHENEPSLFFPRKK